MSLITLPHAIFIYDEAGNPVPITSGSLITSGSRGFIVYGKDGNNEARNFVVDASGSLAIQNPPNLDVSLSSRFNTLGQKNMSGSTPVVMASDQTSLLVESVISDHSGSFANIVKNGTRTALSVEYPALLWEMKNIVKELKIIRQHIESITEEEWDGDI
jgi:hypothetical protein